MKHKNGILISSLHPINSLDTDHAWTRQYAKSTARPEFDLARVQHLEVID